MQNGAQQLFDHLAKFGLQMHIGTSTTKSKTEAMYVPSPFLDKARQANTVTSEPIPLNDNANNIHFVQKFKYL